MNPVPKKTEIDDLLFRLQEGLLPLVTKLDAKKVQLGKLEAEVGRGLGGLNFWWIAGGRAGSGLGGSGAEN